MAVAAGVVIVAITNSSSDDLEEQSPDLEGRCNGTEIYDPILAAAGVEGEVVGTVPAAAFGPPQARQPIPVNVKGSAVGCIPVCFWIEDDGGNERIDTEEIRFFREISDEDGANNFLRSVSPEGGFVEFTAVFRNPTTIASPNPDLRGDFSLFDSNLLPPQTDNFFASSLVDPAEVRVGPGQDDCFIYNSSGQIVG